MQKQCQRGKTRCRNRWYGQNILALWIYDFNFRNETQELPNTEKQHKIKINTQAFEKLSCGKRSKSVTENQFRQKQEIRKSNILIIICYSKRIFNKISKN